MSTRSEFSRDGAVGSDLDLCGLEIPVHDSAFVRRFQGVGQLPVHVGDIRVIQRGEQLRLAAKAGQTIAILGNEVGENFNGNVTIQLGIAGAVDLSHSTRAQWGDDFVWPEFCAWNQRHK